jgi:hypothetical protein
MVRVVLRRGSMTADWNGFPTVHVALTHEDPVTRRKLLEAAAEWAAAAGEESKKGGDVQRALVASNIAQTYATMAVAMSESRIHPRTSAPAVQDSDAAIQELRYLYSLYRSPTTRVLAGRSGVSHTTVADALAGRKIPRWDTMQKILRGLIGEPGTTRAMERAYFGRELSDGQR